MNDKILLGVVDDHPIMRAGMVNLISEFDGLQIILQAANGLELQAQMKKGLIPDIILMDIRMKCMDGFEATAWLREHYPSVKVLALSMVEEGEAIITMIRNGACGFILKESRPSEIVHAIRTVSERGYFLNDLVSGKLIHSLQHPDSCSEAFPITEKERTFIQLCCTELTYKEIAVQMGLSPHTIENYREAVFRKLDVRSRSGIILYAVRNKVVKLT